MHGPVSIYMLLTKIYTFSIIHPELILLTVKFLLVIDFRYSHSASTLLFIYVSHLHILPDFRGLFQGVERCYIGCCFTSRSFVDSFGSKGYPTQVDRF